MRFAYDEKSRGLFIELIETSEYKESAEVADGVVVDFDRKGRPVRIELQDAAAVLDADVLLQLLKPRIRSGDDLRALREQLGVTQQELGDTLEIPRNTIARWERNELQIEKPRLLELSMLALLQSRVRRLEHEHWIGRNSSAPALPEFQIAASKSPRRISKEPAARALPRILRRGRAPAKKR
jgi:DNA-binding transcriptional regulator YiaG